MIITVFSIINLIAICVIAWYAYASHQREKKFRASLTKINEQHQQELCDLYQAIVIATLISANSDPKVLPKAIKIFKEHYLGETKIFGSDQK